MRMIRAVIAVSMLALGGVIISSTALAEGSHPDREAAPTIVRDVKPSIEPTTTTTTVPPTTTTTVPTTTTTSPPPPPAPALPPPPPPTNGDVWERLAQCESGVTNANTGNGYYGYFQFSAGTWTAVGGPGLPTDHDYATQVHYAKILQAQSGWGQWPACSLKLGLR